MKKGDKHNAPRGRAGGLDADLVAAQGLGFLAADPARLGRFLALTGLDPAGLRAAATRPGFTTAILAHLCDDEGLLLAFARDSDLDPDAVGQLARARTEAESWDGA